MIKIGDICPLFFNPIKNEFQQDIDYIQRFYNTDRIILQIFSDDVNDNPTVTLKNKVSGDETPLLLTEYLVNSVTRMFSVVMTGLSDSVYEISIDDANSDVNYTSECFSVCSDNILLQETCLIRYSHEDNNSPFNNIFWIDNIQQIFEFRVEGGFKPEGYSAKVDNEQFRNQFQEIVELYSVPYETYTLTCGNASGIPYWIVQLMNNILSLSDFNVNGEGYVRSGNAIPEMTQVSEEGQMFNMTILLEKSDVNMMDTDGIAVEKIIFLNTPELLTSDRSKLALSNEDAEKIEILYYNEAYKRISVWYGGVTDSNKIVNTPISVYSEFFENGEISVGDSIFLSYIISGPSSKIYSIKLIIKDDYSIEAEAPEEISIDMSQYAKSDLSNAMTVNLAQNGYAKFNNGLLIQWGFSGIGGYNTIYFPMSFYNTNYSLTANERIASAQSAVYSIHLLNMYTSYFTVRGRYHASNGNSGDMKDEFYWIAIGRWK